MTGVGTLIGTGTLEIVPTFISAIMGAFLGDFIGFLIGRLGEKKIFTVWPFKNHKNWLEMGRKFFAKYGTASVIIGRFIGPVRSAVPMVASLLGMSYGRFIAAGICSSILWSLLYILPGYFIGRYSYHLSGQELARWIGFGLVILLTLASIYALHALISWGYRRYAHHRIIRIWNGLLARYRWLSFFCNQDDRLCARPPLLLAWIAMLLCLLLLVITFKPIFINPLPHSDVFMAHTIDRTSILHRLMAFSSWNFGSLAWIFAIIMTMPTLAGLKKSIQCIALYGAIVWIGYELVLTYDQAVLPLVLANSLLWFPLAFCTYTQPTNQEGCLSSVFLFFGIVTIVSNSILIKAHSIALYLFLESWIICAIMVSIFSLLSLRIQTKNPKRYLDSLWILMPCILVLLFILFFLRA